MLAKAASWSQTKTSDHRFIPIYSRVTTGLLKSCLKEGQNDRGGLLERKRDRW